MDEKLEKISEKLTNTLFIIEEVLKYEQVYNSVLETLYDYIKLGFEIKEFRSQKIHFKFKLSDETIQELELRHFITNLMFWEAFMKLKTVHEMDETFILDCTKLTNKYIKLYIDEKIIKPFRRIVSNEKLNSIIHDIIFNLSRISNDFNILLGLSINIETFIDVANKNPRFNEIIRTKLDDNMQPTEVEKTLDGLQHELVQILSTEDNLLKSMLISQAGIKEKQLCEFAVSSGLKPDLSGYTIPKAIKGNYLVGGLSNVVDYYIEALGGRKSSITNRLTMGKSGYFSRMSLLLGTDIKLSKQNSCNTINPITVEIKTKEHLKRLGGRYYKEMGMLSEDYNLLEGDETRLIGSSILLRSPITCNCKTGVCKTCYGELSYINKDINSIGGFAATKITEPISQNILSTKHLLTTNSKMIKFDNEEFYKFFTINSNEISLNIDMPDDLELSDYSILILSDNINVIDEFIEDRDYNKFITIFHLKHIKSGEILTFKEEDDLDLYFSKEFNEIISDMKPKMINEEGCRAYEINLIDLETDMSLFVVEIQNKELTKPLYDIMDLLNKESHKDCKTIDEMTQLMLDLLIISKINVMAVHGEIMVKPLIRRANNILKYPNWDTYGKDSEYQILTIVKALTNHPSVTLSLSFQDLNRQLVNPLTFRKTASSFIDVFYKERP